MKYKCNSGFISKTGWTFRYGDQIDSYTYGSLPYSEQFNFTKVDNEQSTYTSTGTSYDNSSSIDYGSDNSSNSSSSSNDFGGYGGGESGGAGSGGDW